VHNTVGQLYKQLGDPTNAIRHLKTAVDLKPDFTDPMFNLGTAYLNQGDLLSAETWFSRVLRVTPDDAGAQGFLTYIRQRSPASR